jgi:hypothetical protein
MKRHAHELDEAGLGDADELAKHTSLLTFAVVLEVEARSVSPRWSAGDSAKSGDSRHQDLYQTPRSKAAHTGAERHCSMFCRSSSAANMKCRLFCHGPAAAC